LGLLHPPIITRDFDLCSGYRRLCACKDKLGWTSVPIQYEDDPDLAEEIEIEENLKRKNLDWQEEVRWVVKCQNRHPDWSQEKIAAAIGKLQSWVSERWTVHKESEDRPEILKIPVFDTAYKKAKAIKDRRFEAFLHGIRGGEKTKDIIPPTFASGSKPTPAPSSISSTVISPTA
jgi:hypothetical protein